MNSIVPVSSGPSSQDGSPKRESPFARLGRAKAEAKAKEEAAEGRKRKAVDLSSDSSPAENPQSVGVSRMFSCWSIISVRANVMRS